MSQVRERPLGADRTTATAASSGPPGATLVAGRRPPGRPLTAANFRMIAPRGFGDGHNSYPHAMTWFRDRLFVSTTRDNLVLIKMRAPFEMPLAQWPVPVPASQREIDQRAQVWRFDPRDQHWTRVFVSPTERRPDGAEVPVSLGFRAIAVFQGESDSAPALYMPTWAPALLGRGSSMIRSVDGEHFEDCGEITPPNSGLILRSFRALVPFKGRLFTAPTMANVPGQPNVAGVAAVFTTTDPARGGWTLANPPNFGDASNDGVFEIGVFDGHLYAGTANIAQGFQVWRTDAEGDPPFRWTRVVERGAWRGKLNQGTVKMCAFRDHLYVTAAIQNGGYDRTNNIGPAAAEIIRIAKDGAWDVIVGDVRETPWGIKAPLSGYGAGFGNPANGYFWQLCEHDGWLYVSSFDSTVLISFQEAHEMPENLRTILDATSVEYLQRFLGGFDLWRSPDGVNWTPVSMNGFGNAFAFGVRTMMSTEHGLYLGATNPFGPEVAVRRAGGWQYEPNPAGGLEIWLGTSGTSHPPPPNVPARVPEPSVATGESWHDRQVCEELLREFYEHSPLRAIGYWRDGVTGAGRACEELVVELLSLLGGAGGRIGDLGSDGPSTAHLLRYYPAEAVVGICTDARTARACQRVVRGPRFVGDFRAFRLPDASLDQVLCLERLPADETRRTVLRETVRVLKPGGRFVAAEMIRTTPGAAVDGLPGAASDGRLEALRQELCAAGFEDVALVDATYRCWTRFRNQYQLHFGIKRLSRQIDEVIFDMLERHLPSAGAALSHYVLVAANTPSRKGQP